MTPRRAVALDALVWAAWGCVVGLAAARAPARSFGSGGVLTRVRVWEHEGKTWERFLIRSWKHRLPDLSGWLGGVGNRELMSRGREGLPALVVQTRRAELVHWWAMAPIVAMPAWNPAWLTAVMALYAVSANIPCILVQRYNRARAERVLGRCARPRVEEAVL